jgi:hypothetical protein
MKYMIIGPVYVFILLNFFFSAKMALHLNTYFRPVRGYNRLLYSSL